MWKVTVVIGIIVLGACGDDEPAVCNRDGGAACFELPTEAMRAYPMGGLSEPAAIGCGEIVPASSTMAVALRGRVLDYDSGQVVAGVAFEVFQSADYANAIAAAITNQNGDYSMNLASGTPDLLWGKITGGDRVPQLLHQIRPDLGQATVQVDYTTSTTDPLDNTAELVGAVRDNELAHLVVHVLDCGRRPIGGAVVVLSATARARDFVDGAPVFYGVVGRSFPLPAPRGQIRMTGQDGTAVVLNVPVDGGELYVQAWGFPDAAAVARGEDGLVLIAEHAPARRTRSSTRVHLWVNQN